MHWIAHSDKKTATTSLEERQMFCSGSYLIGDELRFGFVSR